VRRKGCSLSLAQVAIAGTTVAGSSIAVRNAFAVLASHLRGGEVPRAADRIQQEG
jgi:hypothetical protein